MTIVRKRALVSGRVQGVFFRDTTRRRAEEAGLAGSARNLPDGRVEVILEGEPEAVDAMITWLHEGPPHAKVDSIIVNDDAARGSRGFKVM